MEHSIVQKIHHSDWRGVFYVTGGGSLLLSSLLTVPGASATVLDARIPYAGTALADVTREDLDQACSPIAAQTLAMQAFVKAKVLDSHSNLFGLGVAASLATNRLKKGKLRAYIALQTQAKSQVSELFFSDDTSRMEQEQLLADTSLRKLASGLGIESSFQSNVSDRVANATEEVARLLGQESCFVGDLQSTFLPGAFNPLHRGHTRMKAMAEQFCGSKVQYELCVRNIDKPPLDFLEIERLRSQFSEKDLVLTNVPKFKDKASLLAPNGSATFVVGIDTLLRIADPDYYRDREERDLAVELFSSRSDRFLVFGRTVPGLEFSTLNDIEIPEKLRQLCEGFSEEQFRMDISSTELRMRAERD